MGAVLEIYNDTRHAVDVEIVYPMDMKRRLGPEEMWSVKRKKEGVSFVDLVVTKIKSASQRSGGGNSERSERQSAGASGALDEDTKLNWRDLITEYKQHVDLSDAGASARISIKQIMTQVEKAKRSKLINLEILNAKVPLSPVCQRIGRRWMACSGALRKMLRCRAEQITYSDYLKEDRGDLKDTVAQIELDLRRTTPQSFRMINKRRNEVQNKNDIEKREWFEKMEKKLGGRDQTMQICTNILISFVQRRRELGYSQGLNYIVYFLLGFLAEEHVFWLLCTLVEDIRLPDFYAPVPNPLNGFQIEAKTLLAIAEAPETTSMFQPQTKTELGLADTVLDRGKRRQGRGGAVDSARRIISASRSGGDGKRRSDSNSRRRFLEEEDENGERIGGELGILYQKTTEWMIPMFITVFTLHSSIVVIENFFDLFPDLEETANTIAAASQNPFARKPGPTPAPASSPASRQTSTESTTTSSKRGETKVRPAGSASRAGAGGVRDGIPPPSTIAPRPPKDRSAAGSRRSALASALVGDEWELLDDNRPRPGSGESVVFCSFLTVMDTVRRTIADDKTGETRIDFSKVFDQVALEMSPNELCQGIRFYSGLCKESNLLPLRSNFRNILADRWNKSDKRLPSFGDDLKRCYNVQAPLELLRKLHKQFQKLYKKNAPGLTRTEFRKLMACFEDLFLVKPKLPSTAAASATSSLRASSSSALAPPKPGGRRGSRGSHGSRGSGRGRGPERIDMVGRIFDETDRDKGGFVNFKELICTLSILCARAENHHWKLIFDIFDDNRSGYLNSRNILQMSRWLVERRAVRVSTQARKVTMSRAKSTTAAAAGGHKPAEATAKPRQPSAKPGTGSPQIPTPPATVVAASKPSSPDRRASKREEYKYLVEVFHTFDKTGNRKLSYQEFASGIEGEKMPLDAEARGWLPIRDRLRAFKITLDDIEKSIEFRMKSKMEMSQLDICLRSLCRLPKAARNIRCRIKVLQDVKTPEGEGAAGARKTQSEVGHGASGAKRKRKILADFPTEAFTVSKTGNANFNYKNHVLLEYGKPLDGMRLLVLLSRKTGVLMTKFEVIGSALLKISDIFDGRWTSANEDWENLNEDGAMRQLAITGRNGKPMLSGPGGKPSWALLEVVYKKQWDEEKKNDVQKFNRVLKVFGLGELI